MLPEFLSMKQHLICNKMGIIITIILLNNAPFIVIKSFKET